MTINIGDKNSALIQGLSDFWLRFFKDIGDIKAYYDASETYLGQVYLDLLSTILNIGVVDTPVFNKEYWKLFTVRESDLQFTEGVSSAEDHYAYDMPGDIVSVDFMQNTIFNPSLLLERGVDFEVEDNDGIARFYDDPFQNYQDTSGQWLPSPGIGWRTLTVEIGNQFTDVEQTANWDAANNVKKGDTLRLLGYRGGFVASHTTGSVLYALGTWEFEDPAAVSVLSVGDMIQVYGSGTPDQAFDGYYLVKAIVNPTKVTLESTAFIPALSSVTNLLWNHYKTINFEDYRDYEIDFLTGKYFNGNVDAPFPLDVPSPIVYSVVRDVAEPEVLGASLAGYAESPTLLGTAFNILGAPWVITNEVIPAGIPLTGNLVIAGDVYAYVAWVNFPPFGIFGLAGALTQDYAASDGVTVYEAVSTTPFSLGRRHIIPGTVIVYAEALSPPVGPGGPVVEGVDYSIDYLRGYVYQLLPWVAGSLGTCDFSYRREVMLSAGGAFSENSIGYEKAISYWVPEVKVDRFNLWYNYGYLLNRFEASSENYKAFLRGIMYLYMSGPILERIEAGLNVAAAYPVTRTSGEILVSYDDGIEDYGSDGTLTAGVDTFATPTHTFVEQDVGGYIIITDPLSDINEGRFRILTIVDANTVELETSYGFVTETPVDWQLSYTYQKTVTTTGGVYKYPCYVPIRTDVMDSLNYNVLTFDIFEPLTTAFTVTDYIEDPYWWHNKQIPSLLWTNASTPGRRYASTQLFPNIVGGIDGAEVGDPGLYVGADEDGNIVTPTDGLGANPVSIYRHNAAFYLFDRYFKLHMFYVEFDPALELTPQFKEDLEELILTVKSSGTYPYVEPNASFVDNVALTEVFAMSFGFFFSSAGDGYMDHMFCGVTEPGSGNVVAQNYLKVGDTNFPCSVGDYYRYEEYVGVTGTATLPVTAGATFTIPVAADERMLTLNIYDTVGTGGENVIEGRDYTVNWLVEDPTGVANPDAWLVTALTDWNATGAAVLVDYDVIVYDNLSVTPIPDTTIGFTPLMVGGLNPGYVRTGALDPNDPAYDFSVVRTEQIDRALSLKIDATAPTGTIAVRPWPIGGKYTYA